MDIIEKANTDLTVACWAGTAVGKWLLLAHRGVDIFDLSVAQREYDGNSRTDRYRINTRTWLQGDTHMIMRGNIFSKILGMDTGLTVVAPNDPLPDGDYSVAYVLHGLCGNNATWADYSMLPAYAAKGRTVYVLPEVARSFYADMRSGFAYFSYITSELPSLCRSLFRISAKRENTAVIGCSMGGYGALKCALSRPDLYGMCGAFSSPCLFLRDGMEYLRTHRDDPEVIAQYGEKLIMDFTLAFGDDLDWVSENDVLALAEGMKDGGDRPRFYSTCGKEDYFLEDNKKFSRKMVEFGFSYQYETLDGGHNFEFFDKALKRSIEIFSL